MKRAQISSEVFPGPCVQTHGTGAGNQHQDRRGPGGGDLGGQAPHVGRSSHRCHPRPPQPSPRLELQRALSRPALGIPPLRHQRLHRQGKGVSHRHGDPGRASGKKKGKPGVPTPRNHPTLYEGTCSLTLDGVDLRQSFVRLRVYTGARWEWINYPTRYNRYFEERRTEPDWQALSPQLVLTKTGASIHFPQTKTIEARKVMERKRDPELVTVAVDLGVKNLAVITVRQQERLLESRFLTDHGLDQHRYRHLKRVAKKQWQSGKPVKGERSNQQIWRHVRRMNEEAARRVASQIVAVCARYPGCVLLFERLRKIKPGGGSKSRRDGPQAGQPVARQDQSVRQSESL